MNINSDSGTLSVNLNVQCQVVLTAAGAEHYNKYLSQFTYEGRQEPNTKAGYIMKTQLWTLMQIFGPMIHMGMCEVPFLGNEIELISSVELV